MRRSRSRCTGAPAAPADILGVRALARLTDLVPVVLGGSLLIGLGLPWSLIGALTTVQKETPDGLLGRVAATANTLLFAPTGLALLAGTAMVALLDYRVQLLAAGALGLTTALLLAVTARAPRRHGPAGPTTEPRPRATDAARER